MRRAKRRRRCCVRLPSTDLRLPIPSLKAGGAGYASSTLLVGAKARSPSAACTAETVLDVEPALAPRRSVFDVVSAFNDTFCNAESIEAFLDHLGDRRVSREGEDLFAEAMLVGGWLCYAVWTARQSLSKRRGGDERIRLRVKDDTFGRSENR